MLSAADVGEVPISISGDPATSRPVAHTIRDVGAVTHALCALQPGELAGVRGPYGTNWPVGQAEGGDVVIIAGGIGLPPLRPAIYEVLANRDRYRRLVLLVRRPHTRRPHVRRGTGRVAGKIRRRG